MLRDILIVGASLAGMRAAEALREAGFDGRVVLIGDELHPPYERPPLSKQVLAGEWEIDKLALAVPETVDELALEWELGRRAVGLDLHDRSVVLADGGAHRFDGLVITTGARPRRLPGDDVVGCHVLRTIEDCLALRAELDATPARVAVVGAGFIGAEVAATCRRRGLDVTVVDPLPYPLARVMPEPIGAVLGELHRDHGVDLRLGVGVDVIDGTDRVRGLRLSDGTVVDADVVVVGIGVVPNSDWLVGSGLTIGDGVCCDASCLAAPGVVAAGDVARWPNEIFGETMRVEHWDNAQGQAEHAALRLLKGEGSGDAFRSVPWFWSDQYDRKIQLAGRAAADAEIAVVDGSMDERRFVALFGKGGRIIGVFGMNRPAPVVRWQRRIAEGAGWEEALAAAAAESS